MTWRRLPQGGREVFFNRDELKTRARAHPPEVFQSESGVRYLSPIDPDGGGTWMAVNEHGLCLALLNRWHETGYKGTQTRGRIITGLAGCRSLDEVEKSVQSLDASVFSPFTLVVLSLDEEVFWEWNGEALARAELQQPLTSSSYCFHEVRDARRGAYHQTDLEKYHSSEGEISSAYTVRMNRPDAQTWSRSVIEIGRSITWRYHEEMPNFEGVGTTTESVLDLS